MTADRPVIGICTALSSTRAGASGTSPRRCSPYSLHRGDPARRRPGADDSAGSGASSDDPDEVLDLIDGLILAGGHDVDPALYGAEPHPATNGTVPERDAVEIALVAPRGRARHAGARDLPRDAGAQRRVRWHAWSSTCPTCSATRSTAAPRAASTAPTTTSRCSAGSLAALAAGEDLHNTKSHHHQGGRHDRRRIRRHRPLDARRAARGDRGAGQAVRARRPVAPGGRRAQPRDRGAGRARRAPTATARGSS